MSVQSIHPYVHEFATRESIFFYNHYIMADINYHPLSLPRCQCACARIKGYTNYLIHNRKNGGMIVVKYINPLTVVLYCRLFSLGCPPQMDTQSNIKLFKCNLQSPHNHYLCHTSQKIVSKIKIFLLIINALLAYLEKSPSIMFPRKRIGIARHQKQLKPTHDAILRYIHFSFISYNPSCNFTTSFNIFVGCP